MLFVYQIHLAGCCQAYPESLCLGYAWDIFLVWRQVNHEPICSYLLLCIHQTHPSIKCKAVQPVNCQLSQLKVQPQYSFSTAATCLKPVSSPGRCRPGDLCQQTSSPCWNLRAAVKQHRYPSETADRCDWHTPDVQQYDSPANNVALQIFFLSWVGEGTCLNS